MNVVSTVAGISVQTYPATAVGLTFVSYHPEGNRLRGGRASLRVLLPASGQPRSANWPPMTGPYAMIPYISADVSCSVLAAPVLP